MATRTSSNLTIASFAGYYGGWASKEPENTSGYYFGTGSSYGPLCIKFKIPSINNFSNRNPAVTFSFEANGVGYYTTCNFTATVRTSNYSSNSTSAQGTAVSKGVKQSMSISASSFSSVTTSAITITSSSVKADNSTYYYCWFTSPGGNYQVRKITGKVYYDAYTQCSAPTSIKFKYNGKENSSPYTHPSDGGTGDVTLQWSGAKAGAGMGIAGYIVQRYDSETGSWDQHNTSVTTSNTYGSCTLATGVRGNVRTYRVITKGSVSGYNSGASNYVYIYFNSKPTAPTGSDLTVRSSVETATIPITLPVTNYSYKTNTRTMILYSSSDEGKTWVSTGAKSDPSVSKIYNFQVDQTPNQGEFKDYKFKMKDNFGDESQVLTIRLTRSVPLEVSSFKATLETQKEGGLWVSFSADTSAHKDSILIELTEDAIAADGGSISSVTVPWKETINLLAEGPAYVGSKDFVYRFTLNASDDFGDTVTKKAKTYLNDGDSDERDIKIGALPNDATLYNTLSGDNISIAEVDGLRFFQNIRAECNWDNLTTASAVLYIGDSSIQYAPKIAGRVFKFELNENEILNKLTSSPLKGRIDFSFSLGTKITNSFSKTIYFSPRPSINIVPPLSTFKMYDQAVGDFQINGVFRGFGLKKVDIEGTQVKTFEITDLISTGTTGYKKEGFNLASLFPLTDFKSSERKGVVSKIITLTATNVLGVTQTAQANITLDFRKVPSGISIGTITYGDETPSNLGTTLLCEGTKIQVPFTYISYGGDSIRFSIYFDGVEKASTTVTPTGAETASGTNQSGTLSFTVPAIPFGKSFANVIVKANLAGTTEVSPSEKESLYLSPYEDPGMNILSSDLSGTTLTLNHSLNAKGAGSYLYELQFEDKNGDWISKISQSEPSPFSFASSDDSPAGNQVARIQIVYTYPTKTTRSGEAITSYSNSFTIFAEGPTVSYRKNYIGINNPSPSDDAVVDIATTSGRNKIKFGNGSTVSIELVASDIDGGPQLIFTKGDTTYTFTFDS